MLNKQYKCIKPQTEISQFVLFNNFNVHISSLHVSQINLTLVTEVKHKLPVFATAGI